MKDAPLHGSATNSNATKPQTERGNQMGKGMNYGTGRMDPSKGSGFRAGPSPSPSMSDKGSIALKGTVGSVAPDSHGSVLSHNPYPNGLA